MAMAAQYQTIYVLGAGFSKPAGFPLVGEFAAKLLQHRLYNWDKLGDSEREDFLRLLEPHSLGGGNFDIERALSQHFSHPASHDFGLLLNGIYACLDGCAAAYLGVEETYLTYFRFLQTVRTSSSAVLTFNYDTVLETTHYEWRWQPELRYSEGEGVTECQEESLSLGFDYHVPTEWRLFDAYPPNTRGAFPEPDYRPLLKLHGGMNWWWCDEHRGWAYSADFSNNTHPNRCGRCQTPVRPNIVPPLAHKNLTDFKELWSTAGNLLRSCEEICFCGYSFPRSDTASIELIAEALSRAEPPQVTVVDYAPPQERPRRLAEWQARFHEFFGYPLDEGRVYLDGVEEFFSS